MNLSKKIKDLKKAFKHSRGLISHFHSRKLEIVVLAIIMMEFLFPQISLAQKMEEPSYRVATIMMEETISVNDLALASEPEVIGNSLPLAAEKEPKQVIWVTVTAYSSTPDQTDSTPCITANGFNVCDHNTEDVVAANFLPFGSKIKMPDYFGDKIFAVQDRMNARYYYRVDVWMKSRAKAKEFGVRRLEIEIY